jgi:phosphotransferase system enzyme I (PtsI)
MIGIVLVSHSPALAEAAYALAQQMVPGGGPRVAIAAGAGEGVIGTDALKVSEAIASVASPDGVLVFMDLGSAVLSAEMALEFTDAGDMPVRLTSAPFVEGLLAGLVRAAGGGSLDDVEREARGALTAKSSQLTGAAEGAASSSPAAEHASAEVAMELTLTNPDGLHARPAALVVAALGTVEATVGVENRRTGTIIPDASSMTSLLTLAARQGDTLRFFATGADADTALAAVRELVLDGFGEGEGEAGGSAVEAAPAGPAQSSAPLGTAAPRAGAVPIGVSPGRAIGVVARMPDVIREPVPLAVIPEEARDAEAARLAPAAHAVERALTERSREAARGRAAESARAILEATALVASDRALVTAAETRVRELGESAERAAWLSMSSLADQLGAQGGRMAERAADIRDVRDRIVAQLQGVQPPGIPVLDRPFVLIAQDLAPADTALLDPAKCVGLITAEGGPTSHTAILARSLGIPAIVAAPGALAIPEGTTVLLDGSTGEVVVDPSPELAAEIVAAPTIAPFDGRGRTADDHRIEILANVASPESVEEAVAASAEGVGLFRTEFCFLDRDVAPTVEEQTAAYRDVLRGFPGRKVVVRTLDAGADKPLPFLTDLAEANPALGVRGYRTSWRRPEILDQQLEAIAAAAAAESAEVWVMAPMIATAAEAWAFAERCRQHGLERTGVMIETPAAALTAREIFEVVDFVSLGTNDLTQYTMAADRLIGDLASLNDAWQPAVLRLIRSVGSAGAEAGKPVGVCGEAGGDPTLAPVLAGLGVNSLSMTPRAIPAVAASLAGVTWRQCVAAASAAAEAASPEDARRAAADLLAS